LRRHKRRRRLRPQLPRRQRFTAPASDGNRDSAEREGKLLKAAAAELRELSPWSMFKSADVLVKAVMIGPPLPRW